MLAQPGEPTTASSPRQTKADLVTWLQARRQSCDLQAVEIGLHASKEWLYDAGRLRHRTGGFFSIVGAALHRGTRATSSLEQPLIDQPEIGILGFVVRDAASGAEILVQGKPEPGNVGLVQAAPTVQATKSNYQRRHRGRETPFLEYFLDGSNARLLSDSLQSEQGTRFLGKYNRNTVVWTSDNRTGGTDKTFRWIPVRDLLGLLTEDFLVNTDARSVLASGPWRFLASDGEPFSRWRDSDGFGEALWRSYGASEDEAVSTRGEILSRLESVRHRDRFQTRVVGLTDLSSWEVSDGGVWNTRADSFSIRQFAVSTTEREVDCWDQPLVTSPTEGSAILFCQERNGVLHFIFSCRGEIGFRDGFQYGPTIQDPGGDVATSPDQRDREAELQQYLGSARPLLSCLQSDEGGRFYRCVSRYTICLLDPNHNIELDERLSWMTLSQIEALAKRPGVFSNEARSLISMLLAYL